MQYPLAPSRFARAVGYFSRFARQIFVPLRQIKRNKIVVFVWCSGPATTAAKVYPFEVRFEQRGPLVMKRWGGKSFRVFASPQKNPVQVKYAAVNFCEEWPSSFTGKFLKNNFYLTDPKNESPNIWKSSSPEKKIAEILKILKSVKMVKKKEVKKILKTFLQNFPCF